MTDKKATKPSDKRIQKRNEADVKGLFAMYGNFGHPPKKGKESGSKKK